MKLLETKTTFYKKTKKSELSIFLNQEKVYMIFLINGLKKLAFPVLLLFFLKG